MAQIVGQHKVNWQADRRFQQQLGVHEGAEGQMIEGHEQINVAGRGLFVTRVGAEQAKRGDAEVPQCLRLLSP